MNYEINFLFTLIQPELVRLTVDLVFFDFCHCGACEEKPKYVIRLGGYCRPGRGRHQGAGSGLFVAGICKNKQVSTDDRSPSLRARPRWDCGLSEGWWVGQTPGRGGTWSGSESSSDHHLANFIIHYSLDEFYSSHSLSLSIGINCP